MAIRKYYLNPAVYAELASSYAVDKNTLAGHAKSVATKAFNKYVERGIEAALIVALELPVRINSHH